MRAWIYLSLAIASEILATSALKASQGMARLLPSAVVMAGYLVSFFLLSLALKSLPLGLTYAVWSGIGTAATALVGLFVWGESLTAWQWLALSLIVFGVALLQGGAAHA